MIVTRKVTVQVTGTFSNECRSPCLRIGTYEKQNAPSRYAPQNDMFLKCQQTLRASKNP